MEHVYKIWFDEQIDTTGIYEEDYIQNTLCFVSSKDLAWKIKKEGEKNNIELEIHEVDILESTIEVLEYLNECSWFDEEYEALKGI